MTVDNRSKLTPIGSSGNKPKVGTEGSGGTAKNDIIFTCPKEIYYQLVPVADWDAGLNGKKPYKFDSVGVNQNQAYCTYVVKSGTGGDSATILRYAPAGYKCSQNLFGDKSREILCKPQTPSMDE